MTQILAGQSAMGQRRIVPINGSGGAAVTISATCSSRKVVIQECAPENPPDGSSFTGGNFNPQGINYTLPNSNAPAQVYPLLPADQLVFDNPWAQGHCAGVLQGVAAQTNPGGQTIPATIYCTMISATATATQVLVIEYP